MARLYELDGNLGTKVREGCVTVKQGMSVLPDYEKEVGNSQPTP